MPSIKPAVFRWRVEVAESTKKAASLSFATQISTKFINLVLSILFVRLAPASSIGTFTLLISAAQLVCSLGRVGTNYSYAVLLPKQHQDAERLQLTSTYVLFGLVSSLILSLIVVTQLFNTAGFAEVLPNRYWSFFGIIFVYLFSDSVSELFWSIHLALGHFKAVFLRDVWIALGKGLLPLLGALWLGPLGVAIGLGLISILNCWVGSNIPRQQGLGSVFFLRTGFISRPLLIQLLLRGVPFFSVPLVSNLILWPLLMTVASTSGIEKLDTLRVAQICAQILGVISGSLIPVLLVKSSWQPDTGLRLHQQAFQICWVCSVVIYGLYALSDRTLLPLVFGSEASEGAIQISRILVAAAAVQGLSQIPMQRPLKTRTLVMLSLLQIGSLVVAAIVAISIFNPMSRGLLTYASINLLSPLITVICLPVVIRKGLMPGGSTPWAQILVSLMCLTTCFLVKVDIFQTSLLIASIVYIIHGNLGLIRDLKPKR